ncbi:MAG: lipid A biosynthesis acyltransferase [Acidobacteria bacterium]|nr:MAG: lipid A biosynthesis acyltransferase [Acidobacteriota bacterium]
MNKSNLQIDLEYGVVRFMLAVFASMPLRAALRIGASLAVCFSWCAGRLRHTGERNLEIAFPELSIGERRLLLRRTFGNLGRLLGVFSQFTKQPENLLEIVDRDGFEYLAAAKQAGRGIILFTGHVGAWELSSFALSLFGHPLSFLVRRIDNPKIEAMIDRARTHLGNRTIDKRSAAREMMEILRAGETLGILVDLNTLDREGIFVDFFGRPASTTFMVAKLALRTGAAVLPVFAPWDKERGCFLLKVDPPLLIERTGNEQEDVRRLTQQYTRIVEDYVRRYPDQWLWIHRRWKTRPPGEPEIYGR